MRDSLRLSLLALLVPSILAIVACSKSQAEVPVAEEQPLKDAEALFQRAVRMDAQGLHQEARRAFEEVLDAFREGARRRPDFAKLHYAIGVVLTHLDRYDEALRAYQEAVRLKPDLAEAYPELAATLNHLGRNHEGLRAYQEGVRLKPDLATSHGYLEALLKPRRPITDPTQRLQLQGVSILPPRGEKWLIFSQSTSHVKFTKSTTKGPNHIVIALVETETRRDLTFKTSKEFSQHITQETKKFGAFGLFFSSNVSLENCLGRECVRVDFTVETFGKPYAPGSVYVLTGREYYVLHPDSPGVILKLSYNQRFRKGEKPLPIEDEVEASFKSLVFSSNRTKEELARQTPGGVRVLVNKSPADPHGSMKEKSPKREISETLLVEVDLSSWRRGSLEISPDSRRVGYEAKIGNKHFLVMDGKVGKPYGFIVGLKFSPDSKRVAYGVAAGGKPFVVVDGREEKQYEKIDWGSLIFSPDSKRVAYAAGAGGRRFVVVDGREGKPYDDVGSPNFSPDSKRVAYHARVRPQGFFMVVDEQEGKPFEVIQPHAPIFSPDSKRVAYAAAAGGEAFVVFDGQKEKPYAHTGLPRFSPDSKRVAYEVARGGERFVVLDRQEGKSYESIVSSPVFSPDSKRVAYAAYANGKQFVVLDGKEGQPYDRITCCVFSPDSQRVAYDAQVGPDWPNKNKRFLVVDGKEGKPYDGIGAYRFSPDSKRVAYHARVGTRLAQWFLVVDGKEGKPYESTLGPLIFSPDSKRVAHVAQVGEKWFVVVDGEEGNPYDAMGFQVFESKIIFDSANRLHYIAPRGNRIFLVEETIR